MKSTAVDGLNSIPIHAYWTVCIPTYHDTYIHTWALQLFTFTHTHTHTHTHTLHILTDDSYTYWKIPGSGGYNWVAFDFGSKYTLTGIRLSGWYEPILFHECISVAESQILKDSTYS